MAGVKDGIEGGELSVKLLNICPGFLGTEKKLFNVTYERIKRSDGLPFDLNIEDALKKKMTPVVNVEGLCVGSNVTTHAMVAYLLTDNQQELVKYTFRCIIYFFSSYTCVIKPQNSHN